MSYTEGRTSNLSKIKVDVWQKDTGANEWQARVKLTTHEGEQFTYRPSKERNSKHQTTDAQVRVDVMDVLESYGYEADVIPVEMGKHKGEMVLFKANDQLKLFAIYINEYHFTGPLIPAPQAGQPNPKGGVFADCFGYWNGVDKSEDPFAGKDQPDLAI